MHVQQTCHLGLYQIDHFRFSNIPNVDCCHDVGRKETLLFKNIQLTVFPDVLSELLIDNALTWTTRNLVRGKWIPSSD